jgi:murein DD-endopeptidase MepM/ murein hydrolase activator NlpD
MAEGARDQGDQEHASHLTPIKQSCQRQIGGGLIIAGAVLALIPTMGAAHTDPQPEPMLVPPVSPACISSPFGPRVLANHPQAGTYHHGVDLPAPPGAAIVATASGKVIRIQKKGPGGLEILVQHDGFVAIYSHLGMAAPAFAQGKRTVAAGEKLGVVGRTGVTAGTHVYFEMLMAGKPIDPAPYLHVPKCEPQVRPPSLSSSPNSQ